MQQQEAAYTHSSGAAVDHGVDKVVEAVLEDGAGVEGHVLDGVVGAVHLEDVGNERVPVVEVVELCVDTVVVLMVRAV